MCARAVRVCARVCVVCVRPGARSEAQVELAEHRQVADRVGHQLKTEAPRVRARPAATPPRCRPPPQQRAAPFYLRMRCALRAPCSGRVRAGGDRTGGVRGLCAVVCAVYVRCARACGVGAVHVRCARCVRGGVCGVRVGGVGAVQVQCKCGVCAVCVVCTRVSAHVPAGPWRPSPCSTARHRIGWNANQRSTKGKAKNKWSDRNKGC